MPKITIDDQELEVPAGSTIIQAADEAGIYIPRFCYHKKLSVAANCRMCLVEVEKAPKTLPACATPIMDGMVVKTCSEKAKLSQKAVMEFLLVNHPLDCPICDQGGQCELQDLSLEFGADASQFAEKKRAVIDPDLGPFIATEMTRCIHCTRCVRFGSEVAGADEMGATNRGEHMTITNYVKKAVRSELSGNMIDVCPVGALTSKPFRFKARAWELNESNSIAPHDCVGSSVSLGVLRNQLLRVTPRQNEAINEVWLSDRDRFSYMGVHGSQRVKSPMIKKGGRWAEVDWITAFDYLARELPMIASKDANHIGVVANPSATVEEYYLLQKWARGLGTPNIDHRLREKDHRDDHQRPLMPLLGVSIAELSQQNAFLLIGSDVRREQPIANMKIRQAVLKGAEVFTLNGMSFDWNYPLKHQEVVKPSQWVYRLACIAKALLIEKSYPDAEVKKLLSDITPDDKAQHIAKSLLSAEKGLILLGLQGTMHHQSSELRYFTQLIAQLSDCQFGELSDGANSSGAWLTGCVPHRGFAGQALEKIGLSAYEMFRKKLPAYVLFNTEPELDAANAHLAMSALEQARLVVAIHPFMTDRMRDYADVILPLATFGETSGTFINADNTWQHFRGALKPYGESRPGWKILRVLGNVCRLPGFDYTSSEDVMREIETAVSENKLPEFGHFAPIDTDVNCFNNNDKLERLTTIPMYAVDSLTRQSTPLKSMLALDQPEKIRMHSETMKSHGFITGQKLSVKQNGCEQRLMLLADDRIAPGVVCVPAGIEETVSLGDLFGEINVQIQ